MTHFVDDPQSIVTDSIDGLIRVSAGRLTRLDGYPAVKVVQRADWSRDRVAVISGGGAGHEPAHAGFVGEGLLTAAVSGEIFASPSVEAILNAIVSVTGDAGCLLVVKNYTGDRLNFGLAKERATALGYAVDMVVVADDVALASLPQPRGLAGTLLVHKVAGARAAAGAPLAEVTAAALKVAAAVKTLGVSVSGVNIPHRPSARAFADGTGELGLGIHGEPGLETVAITKVRGLVATMATRLAVHLPADVPLAVLVNNLGGVSALELGIVVGDLLDTELGRRIELVVGPAPLMTSLDMRGFSLSAVPLDDALREALLAPVDPVAAWPGVRQVCGVSPLPLAWRQERRGTPSNDPRVRRLLDLACSAILDNRSYLDELDARIGDGDTGSTFANAARQIRAELDSLPLADTASLLIDLSQLVSASMGASSGVLISIMLAAAGSAVERGARLVDALVEGVEAMQTYGGAALGDRTMLDALIPAVKALQSDAGIGAAADAARAGAEATAEIDTARAGRASYVGSEHLRGAIDPGAAAIAVIVTAVSSLD